ncbi:sigma-54 dependent transcriptional regulator [Xylophilus sp. GOD-11R]|uniref:sigma-54-dependent transcriptional regulator n=1 Tax=Xylophilus sp. GOD-11R TaxID=3089814 RepID=UPI00298BFD97|nr:sigma-54 dependent transcriptional regulator [Xylophilus sp. GOD-11R]WPB56160.1 sigma-54 dependent transcriptional regulator [Xylophilus sp. GOD-11R]
MTATPRATAQADTTILVIDDEPDLRTLYELTLLREGYRVAAAGTLAEAHDLLQLHRYGAVITDMRLPDGSGLEVLNLLRTGGRAERCVVMTAYGSAENAVEALKAGAFDYLTKPVDLRQFRTVVAAAVQTGAAGQVAAPHPPAPAAGGAIAPRAAPAPSGAAASALARMVGDSAAMQAVRQRIAKVARTMAPVLIRGESGTGKELVARALHASSHRASGPMVAVNCSAIPENLLESEFFGARKGAYTGAAADREGYFQAARGGTLFLDEIGDLPLAMQSKLLRAIQERCVRPVGSAQEDMIDVRIVSATHRDLAADVRAGGFRQDLYYRLNVIEVVVPPLRERREDLPQLAAALLERISRESGLPAPQLTPQSLERLRSLPLAGNVRELENLLHRAVALSDGDTLELETAVEYQGEPIEAESTGTEGPLAAKAPVPMPDDLQAYLDAREREILVKALAENRFNRTAAAAQLGISLRQIRYRIARLGIAGPRDSQENDGGADED